MAVVARGWSKTASTAVKLATAERIIGYQFNDVDRLYEALDQTKQPYLLPSGNQSRERRRNGRLATLGDAHARLHMAQKYYDNPDLFGAHWGMISTTTLSNDQMSESGFKLGLEECGIPNMIETRYDMATTVEAVFAAVEMDGAGREKFHKVMARFGIQHRLVEPIQRAWIYEAVKSKLDLPDRFFIGHHFRLQEGIFETKLKRSTNSGFARPKRIRRKVTKLWKGVKQLWHGPPRKPPKPKKICPSLRAQGIPERRLVARSSEAVRPLAKGPQLTSTETTTTTSKDVATSETKILGEESPDRLEDDERAVTPGQTTDRGDPVENHKGHEVSSSEIPTPSQPPKSRPPKSQSQFVHPNEGTAEDDIRTVGNGSQDSNKACTVGPLTALSSNLGAASDAELEAGHQPREASGAELIEATEAGDTPAKYQRIIRMLYTKDKELGVGQLELEQAFRHLNLAKKKKPKEQAQKLIDIKIRRQRLKRLQLFWKNKLKQLNGSKRLEKLDQQS